MGANFVNLNDILSKASNIDIKMSHEKANIG